MAAPKPPTFSVAQRTAANRLTFLAALAIASTMLEACAGDQSSSEKRYLGIGDTESDAIEILGPPIEVRESARSDGRSYPWGTRVEYVWPPRTTKRELIYPDRVVQIWNGNVVDINDAQK